MVYLVKILYTYVFQHCQATGMKKCDEAAPSIIFGGQALLVKMLITLEQHGIFGSNFVQIYILTLSSHWYEKKVTRLTRLHRASFWPIELFW